MKEMKDIAVIIPAYKAHKTIKQTLCSLARQFGVSYKVYIVSDGEKKGTYDYLKKMFDFIDIKILYKPTNGGPGLARQYAIDHTKEPFITFIDADDILSGPNSLYTMRMAFEDRDALIVTPFFKEDAEGKFILQETSVLTWMHGKMYRRSFLEKYKVHFNDVYSGANEDVGFNTMIALISDGDTERIKQLNSEYVTYIQLRNPNSITNRNNGEFSRTVNVEGFVYNKLYAFKYAVEKLGIMNIGVKESAIRSFVHIYINYVGINNDVEGFAERVDTLALLAYEEYKKIWDGVSKERIEEIEEDMIHGLGLSYKAYKDWKATISKEE